MNGEMCRQADTLPGIALANGPFPASAAGTEFLFDTAGWDAAASRRCLDQQIMKRLVRMIGQASRLVVVDFFLWNDWDGPVPVGAGSPSHDLADALLGCRAAHPEAVILVLTDPINRAYGRHPAAPLQRLIEGGIPVVWTDLERLPDSNRLYSVPARRCARLLRGIGPFRRFLDGLATHPFAAGQARVRRADLLRLLHFKANHRKIAVTDAPDGSLRALVTSMNPHDGSAAHTNTGLCFSGAAARAAAEGELACLSWSSGRPGGVSGGNAARVRALVDEARARLDTLPPSPPVVPGDAVALTWLTEAAIRAALLERLAAAGPGSLLRGALFYLSDRGVLAALAAAVHRGAEVRLILDPNRDAFGRRKNGIPNRPSAAGLRRRSAGGGAGGNLCIRWADTHGEQFHAKTLSLSGGVPEAVLLGSANWTRRNLAGFNMEAGVLLEGPPAATRPFNAWFDRLWCNADGCSTTLPWEAYAETGPRLLFKRLLCRLQESTGLGTF